MIAATCTTDVNSKIHKQLQPTSCSLDSQNTSDSCQPQNTFAWQLVIQTFKEYTSKRVCLGHRIKIKWGTHCFYLKSGFITHHSYFLWNQLIQSYSFCLQMVFNSVGQVPSLHSKGPSFNLRHFEEGWERDPCLKAEEAIDNQCWQ